MKNILIFGLLIGGGLYLFSRKKFSDALVWGFQKMAFNWKKKKISVALSASNPTGQTATITAIVGSLLLNGSTMANVEYYQPQTIKAQSKSLINLDIIPSGAGIMEQIKGFAQGLLASKKSKSKEKMEVNINARFIGNAIVDGIQIPLDLKLM